MMPAATRRAAGLAAGLPPLLLRASRLAATIDPGPQARRRAGPGERFWQARAYRPGDPVGRIDWRASARAEHVYVREQEWEAAPTLVLWRDHSASMRWGSARAPETKLARADLLLLAAALLLRAGGARLRLLGAPGLALGGGGGVARLAAALPTIPPAGLPPPEPLPRRARLLLIGDFLAPPEAIAASLRPAAAAGADGVVVQVLDPAEHDLPYAGRVRFTGLEDEGSYLAARAEGLRAAYQQEMAAHQDALGAICRAHHLVLLRHRTDAAPTQLLLALHAALNPPP